MSDQNPVFVTANVRKGHGFRSNQRFGIPIASIPYEAITEPLEDGLHLAFASVNNGPVYKAHVWTRKHDHPLLFKLGYRKREHLPKVEVHILHKFESDLYGKLLRLCIFPGVVDRLPSTSISKEGLLEGFRMEFERTERILDSPQYKIYEKHRFFHSSSL